MDRKRFFSAIRATVFGGRLTTAQVVGTTAVLDEWERSGVTDQRQLAYTEGENRQRAGRAEGRFDTET